MKAFQALIDTFTERKVLVIGDAILDVYMNGVSEKICREAPAPVINLQEQVSFCGGAANTALNLAALGARPLFLTVIGSDQGGRELLHTLHQNAVDTSCVICDPERKTIVKRRISSSQSILVRIDEGSTDRVSAASRQAITESFGRFIRQVDAVVISDYECGVVTAELMENISKFLLKHEIPLIVDAKDPRKYRDLHPTLVKPNYDECVRILDISKRPRLERVDQILGHGKRLLELTGAKYVAATMDVDGTILFERDKKPYRISSDPRNDNETIGAGDTFVSAAALAFCSGAAVKTAVEIASAAALIALRKEGTGICYGKELKSYFNGDQKVIKNLEELEEKVGELKRFNKKVIFTNGCFDILHRGHVTFLNQAKALGDILVVGLNTDESIRKVKGNGRPINSLEDRIAVLAALQCVNYLIAFDEVSPVRIIKALKPYLFVKGGTYTIDSLPESELVESLGGEVRIIPFITGLSTTKLIEKIRKPLLEVQDVKQEGRMV